MTSPMTRTELTEKLLGIKRENGWTWKHICAEIGGMSPVLITEMPLFLSLVWSCFVRKISHFPLSLYRNGAEQAPGTVVLDRR